MTPVLQLFAKAPVAGECKTRLIPALGAQGAAQLHERLVHHQLATAQQWLHAARAACSPTRAACSTVRVAPPTTRIELWCAPDIHHPFFAACAQQFGVTLHTQTGPDLGARMWLALCAALACGERPVLTGTDCPWLNADDISAAFAALDNADAVYAPAHDGGYVLTGLARAVPELFANIAWGTGRVMSATRDAARRTRQPTRLALLRTLHDVDTAADLARLKADKSLTHLLEGLIK